MSRLLMLLVGIVAAGISVRPAAAGEACFSDWSLATPIVKKEGLVTVDKLTPLAKTKLEGDIVKVTLCEEGGRYVFRLVVKDARGNLKTVTVDAKNPF